jgi:hypothetical protein
MAEADQKTLEMVTDVARTARRLAQRMGGVYVLNQNWQERLNVSGNHQKSDRAAAQG